jgi:hypothetical protein
MHEKLLWFYSGLTPWRQFLLEKPTTAHPLTKHFVEQENSLQYSRVEE